MKSALRIIGWTVAGLAGLLIAASIAIDLGTRTAAFRNYLRERVTGLFDQAYEGRLTVGGVEGSLWSGLRLREVALSLDGRPILTIRRVRVTYALALIPLLRREITLTRIVAEQPALDLRRRAGGQWNLLAALKERHPSPPSGFDIVIRALILDQAAVHMTGTGGQSYALEQGRMGAAIFAPAAGGVEVDVRYLEGAIRAPYLPAAQVTATLAYQSLTGRPSLTVREFELQTRESLLRISGVAADLDQQRIDFNLDLIRLAPDDLAKLVPAIHPGAPMTGNLRFAGVPADLTLTGEVAAGPASLQARINADVSAKSPTYSGDVIFAGIDVAALAARPELSAKVSGRCHLTGMGTALAKLGGDADLTVRGLGWRGYRAGDLHVTGALKNQVVSYAGRITGPAGALDSQGTLSLVGEPSYQLRLQATNFRPQGLNPTLKTPPADLNFTAALKGQGFKLAAARATLEIRWLRSQAGRLTIAGGYIGGNLANGWVAGRASMSAADAALALAGRVRVVGETAGNFSYQATSSNLAPWMEMAGYRGGGGLKLSGSAAGTAADFRTRGTLSLSQAEIDGKRAGSASLDFDLSGGRALWIRAGRIAFVAQDVEAGGKLQSLTAQVELRGRGPAIQARLQAAARDAAARDSALSATVDYTPNRISGRIERLELGLPDGMWRLPQAADITYDRRRLEVGNLMLRRGRAELAAHGVVTVAGAQDFHLSVQGLRIGDLKMLAGRNLPIDGAMVLDGRISGTAAAPVIAANLNVTAIEAGGERYTGLRARLEYGADRARLSAVLDQDASHSLQVEGMVPVALGWSHGWKMESAGDADLRVSSTGLSLAFVGGLAPATLRQVSGALVVDMRIGGPLASLRPRGSIGLRGVSFLMVPANVKVADLSADAALNADRITLTALSAHADQGVMRASGSVMLSDMAPREVALDLRLTNWPAMRTAQYHADIDGAVRCNGPMRNLTVDGSIEVLRAELRPELRFMNAGATKVDRTIVVIRPGAPRASPPPRAGALLVWRKLTIALGIAIHRNSWIRAEKSAVEIRGDLRITKAPGHDLEIAGTIDSVRGVVQVVNQNFTLTRAQLVFTGGGRINPSLDILAQRQLPNYIVQAIIQGTAEKPTLTLQSQPELPQSEILSLLMFGNPVGTLSGAQQQSLQQQALSMATGFAAGQLAQSVASALGLQGFGAGGAGVGGYVAPGLFISAGQDTSGVAQGGRAAIDYNLTRNLDVRTSTSSVNGNQIELRLQKNY